MIVIITVNQAEYQTTQLGTHFFDKDRLKLLSSILISI